MHNMEVDQHFLLILLFFNKSKILGQINNLEPRTGMPESPTHVPKL